MDPSAVRTAIADQVADAVIVVGGVALNVQDHLRGSITPPVFAAGEVEIIPDQVAEGGLDDLRVTCHLYTSTSDDAAGQALLDRYLATSGPTSVRAALLADPTLGGLVQMAWIERITGYGKYRIAALEQPEIRYFGARIFMHVQGA